ncbi:hypothetical protein DL95DRAFT_406257 [Leptodontidium sp. 2 PMI_412]|nr:hypothetical protein DL95DRAFT_406257 [Leptodontidium sp. 2 PMI_412]
MAQPRHVTDSMIFGWHFGLPGPRVIEAKYPGAVESKRIRTKKPKISRRSLLECHAHVPSILHVCRESREVALKVYRVAFGGAFRRRGPLYFHFSRDTSYTSHTNSLVVFEKNYRSTPFCDDRQDVATRLEHVVLGGL